MEESKIIDTLDMYHGNPLRATGLPCIASPEIKSSSNTQHLGTENNRFIDASGNIVRYYIK